VPADTFLPHDPTPVRPPAPTRWTPEAGPNPTPMPAGVRQSDGAA
jgi:hypothetical protein